MTIKELITYLTEKADGDLDMEVKFKYWSHHMEWDDRDFVPARMWWVSQELTRNVEEISGTPCVVISLE